MNLKELAGHAGMNYYTLRKYYVALKERGLVTQPSEDIIPLLKQIAQFTSEGLTVQSAIDKIAKRSNSPQAFTSVLLRLEEKIDNLENENKALRDLVQIQLAEMKKMLPKPDADTDKSRKKPFWKFW